MSRLKACFEQLHSVGRKALIPYITAGDPSLASGLALMRALVAGGADVIELGVPFSDPMADGPVIQRAAERAVAQGVKLTDVLALVRTFRQENTTTPVVLMGYANPIERMGWQRFAASAADSGVDGVLVVDYPPEEAGGFAQCLRAVNLDPIFLLAPTSTDERIARVAELASGYVYYVSLRGVTGAGHLDADAVARDFPRLRAQLRLPIGVGFGIRDATSARAVGAVADAVVIGSALVQLIEREGADNAPLALQQFLQEIRIALDLKEVAS
ncbi:tryptophan synthase subunit alpha [Inhella gelatinilytica]|uniref:Tryptophan synthase alpha chain n=1 Tax=Inhella gelatinilytica TaxID=2795030 RepID=A0A931NDX2_9BURK|nr:tryptophan synthase subunit alpha [Inhella gelatinilytica]MBH9553084.1 tryptophan synthase subunit alpha [Inhella gelatinilytica]